MEVDWPIFLKFLLCILEKSLKIGYGLFFLVEKPLLIFSSRCSINSNFICYKTSLL